MKPGQNKRTSKQFPSEAVMTPSKAPQDQSSGDEQRALCKRVEPQGGAPRRGPSLSEERPPREPASLPRSHSTNTRRAGRPRRHTGSSHPASIGKSGPKSPEPEARRRQAEQKPQSS